MTCFRSPSSRGIEPEPATEAARLDRAAFCMGTSLGLHLRGAPREVLLAASTEMLEEIERIEAACSTRRPASPWSHLNGAGGQPVPLATEWLELLGAAQAWQQRTQGAFEPVLGALIRAWSAAGGNPGADAVARARQACGANLLRVDRGQGTAQLLHPEAGLAEGGFVKGYALDAARRIAPVPSGWLDFGGQILAWGAPLEVAIAAPEHRGQPRISIQLADGQSVSCSGCAERGRHLLDPRSGEACADWGSVAVVAASGLDAEALSTALYVEGPEAGPERAEALGAAAAFLLHGGMIRTTPAFQRLNPVLVAQGTP